MHVLVLKASLGGKHAQSHEMAKLIQILELSIALIGLMKLVWESHCISAAGSSQGLTNVHASRRVQCC